jgi:hypothetical protein
MNGERKCGVFLDNGIIFSLTKQGSPVICNNTDEPGGHNLK